MLNEIQQKLKAPKDKKNEFGGYMFRSAASILEAAKPVLSEAQCSVILSDEVVAVGNRIYVKANAMLFHEGKCIAETHAYAREQEAKKGMDEAQITGAASSYARKYALCGLFAIDESADDPDTKDNRKEGDPAAQRKELHDAAWDEYLSEIRVIRKGINSGTDEDLAEAVAVYYSIPEQDQIALALAQSKGGQWTPKEYAFFKSNEWSKAKNQHFGVG